MESTGLVFGVALAVGGLAALTYSALGSRRSVARVSAFLREMDVDEEVPDEFHRKLSQPFSQRLVSLAGARVAEPLGRLLPHRYLDTMRQKLALAGTGEPGRAERVVASQVVLTFVLSATSALLVAHLRPPARYSVLLLFAAPLVGVLLPWARVDRQMSDRKQSILKDLPDTLDLLAISVEAGIGFEGALAVVTQHFDSPLADEFSRTLREMELGLPRHDAFQNLKRRTEVPALSNFILALLQGDALGIPIGRILKTQAADMRSQRRMWAREKAAKLPVKMLFPMIMFIFPPVFVVVMGPAAGSITHGFG